MKNRNEQKEQKNIESIIVRIAGIVFLAVYGLACMYLYFMQSNNMEGQYFESDLPYHINMALDGWGYSVTAIVYKVLCFLPLGHLWIALFLALCTVGTIWVLYRGLLQYEKKGWICILIAGASSVVMPFFIKTVQHTRYIGYQSPTIWHNSTYIVMKFLAVIALLYYFKLCKTYFDRITSKEWITFALLLMFTTATKTSFIMVFAPTAFVFLIIDFILGVPLKKILTIATTIIPSCLVILFQEMVLFGKDTGNGISIDFGYTVFLRTENPEGTMILSALFPVLIFLFNIVFVIKDTIKDLREKNKKLTHRIFLSSWTMWFAGAVELLFLAETGERLKDANFTWGYDFALFVLFVVSVVYFIRNLQSKTFLGGKIAIKMIYGIVLGGCFAYHVYCGIYFFVRLMQGTTYFM